MKRSLGPMTLVYPTPVFVIGTYDLSGKPNIMTVAWAGLCCSSPPCVAIATRKATYTYGNLVDRKAFTLNIPSQAHIRETDYAGLVSGRTEDKFTATGLTAVPSSVVDAPYVEEFPVAIECVVRHMFELGLHTQFVGEILDVKIDDAALAPDGLPDIKKLNPMVFSPEGRGYYGIGELLGKPFSIGKTIDEK